MVCMAAKPQEGEFKADGLATNGGVRGIVRCLGSHANPSAVGKLLVGSPRGSCELRVLDVGGGAICVNRYAGLEGDILLVDFRAVPICLNGVVTLEPRRHCGVGKEGPKGAGLATANGFVIGCSVLAAVDTFGLNLPPVPGQPGRGGQGAVEG
jgi:hypothetical protein